MQKEKEKENMRMGWYHVAKSGKGMYLGEERKIVFQEDKLIPYLPTKDEAIKIGEMSEEKLKDYDEWPIVQKLASVDRIGAYYFEEEDFFEDFHNRIIANGMHCCFEKRYGYPFGSFRSVSDYDDNVMIFCNSLWPPKEYNKNLAELTEEKLEKQLQEFLTEITGDSRYADKKLELCEEYTKT